MSQLFERVVRPLATPETPGAFLGGLRVMAVDGTVKGFVQVVRLKFKKKLIV